MGKLPFVARIFWKTLAVVAAAVVVGWWLIVKFTDYEMIPADYGGSVISSILLTYLIHLWLLPSEHLHHDDEPSDE